MTSKFYKFFNRELSWLEFNGRVLSQALRKELPLLERLQFLSIVSSNFDEFFQVRVASVMRLAYENPETVDSSGISPLVLLEKISERAHQIIDEQQNCLLNEIFPLLAKQNIVYVKENQYTTQQREYLLSVFKNDIFPLLTPLRTDTESFPHIKNLSQYVGFVLKPIEGIKISEDFTELTGADEADRVAFVEIPGGLKKIWWLPEDNKKQKKFVLLEDIISLCGSQLFPGFNAEESLIFKVARDADFAVDEDSGKNFIMAMENVLIQRKSSFAVQLICKGQSDKILKLLTEKLELTARNVYKVPGVVDLDGLMELRSVDEDGKLSFENWEHFYPSDLPEDEPFWDVLKYHDKILHVPYEKYDPVIKFINDAAEDPKVLAIKMTLYRTGRDSPIVYALENAAQKGKQVVVLVELKARFDEERNIAWANELEKSGVTVIYGLVNLKVHAKILMIMRKESDTIRRYVHLSTGNYNPKTAKLYSDISLFTANPEIANDATNFFNLVTGYSTLQKMNQLTMAPVTLKAKLLTMIQREIDRSTPENPGLIIAKMNSLTHEEIIEALYRASNAGVKIFLNVRGICTLVPGVELMSENIKVVSIVDRYLEHSRIFYFQNGGTPELYCSSADWMPRNLDRRIELMFPILDADAFSEVKSILDSYFMDNTNAKQLLSDGRWVSVEKSKKDKDFNAQASFYRHYKKNAEDLKNNQNAGFEVRRK